jgi:chromosomal replication initiator protein
MTSEVLARGTSPAVAPAIAFAAPLAIPPLARAPEASLVGDWSTVRDLLRRDLGEHIFKSWFERLDVAGLSDGTLSMTVPTRFLRQWISTTYRDKLLDTWSLVRDDVRRLDIEIRSSAVAPARAPAEPTPLVAARAAPSVASAADRPKAPLARAVEAVVARHATDPGEELAGSPLDARFTFATYRVGRSNHLAHAAATQVAEALKGTPVPFNPLYVHGSVGLGKTHLLQALAHAARGLGRRVLYLTVERFMHAFAQSLQAKNAMAFKDLLRGIELLLIDDLQFLSGKTMQAEFGHTLNALLDGSRQVVIACDRPPSDLEMLDERLLSRLGGGLVVSIAPPEQELRLRILKQKVETTRERYPGFQVPEDVLAYVSHAVDASARELDGAITRLAAHNQLTHAALTIDLAEQVLRDLVRQREPKRVKIEEIQRVVAKHYQVSRADMLSQRRTKNVVLPRQIAMYLAKVLTPRSLPDIGRRFSGRDHTTVLHAVRKIDGLVKKEASVAQEVELLKRLVMEG